MQNSPYQEMHNPPYDFLPMPYEFLTPDFLKDPIMMRLVVWMFNRLSLYPKTVAIKGMSKAIDLDPFEFIFRREISALDAGISPKNAYTRMKQLIGLGYIKKVASKTSSTYSVFALETKAFRQND